VLRDQYVVHVMFEAKSGEDAVKAAKALTRMAQANHGANAQAMGPFKMADGQENPILAYCDGACDKQGVGGWAYRIEQHDGIVQEASGGEKIATNNTMELKALIQCLIALPGKGRCIVFTDSQYVKRGYMEWMDNWVKKGWVTSTGEPVKNRSSWDTLLALRGAKPNIEVRWVKGHNGTHGNERVDALATQARRAIIKEMFDGT